MQAAAVQPAPELVRVKLGAGVYPQGLQRLLLGLWVAEAAEEAGLAPEEAFP